MSSGSNRPPTGRDGRSWQNLVWVRIAIDRLRRSRPLQRPDRLRPSLTRRYARLIVVVAIGLGMATFARQLAGPADRVQDCAAAVPGAPAAVTVFLCLLEFQRTDDPMTGIRLAQAMMDIDAGDAKPIAARQLATPARAEAHQLLGHIAATEGKLDDAIMWLETARTLHLAEGNLKGVALDGAVLASVLTNRSDFAGALRRVDECITQAERTGDQSMEVYCRVVASRTLIRAGYFSAAEREINGADRLAVSRSDRVEVAYQYANLAQERRFAYQHANLTQERERHRLAKVRFTNALELSKDQRGVEWTINTNLNLAYSLAEIGDIDKARRHLDEARRLDPDDERKPERTWTAAQIAYRQGDLARAAALTDEYIQLRSADTKDGSEPAGDLDDRDDRLDVEILRARIELDRNDLRSAELWAQRAINDAEGIRGAEHIRGAQSVLELRPWVLHKRRSPYELRFAALACGGDAEAATLVFNQWQGRTVQDALATPRAPASLGRRDIADRVTKLGTWFSAVSHATFATPPDDKSVLDAMHSIDLLALIVANGDVWQLTASHGAPRLHWLSPLADIEDLIARFRGQPGDVQLASDLGARLLPPDVFRNTREVLHVVVDHRLAGLPVAALRHGGRPLIANRPVVHELRLPVTRCAHVARTGNRTVLGKPGADLDEARTEADEVARLLGTTSKTGGAATKAALFAASSDAVLHVAAHSVFSPDGVAISLANGRASALEIVANRVAPSLVVLSSCNAATSNEDEDELAASAELSGSLAAGFLAAGSQHVVATLGVVTDKGALEFSRRFYAAGGVADPARAVRAAQLALEKDGITDWPFFITFGPDVCPEGETVHP